MKVVMLKTPWCGICRTVERIYGDRVETVDIIAHPEWLDKTSLTTVPICMSLDGDIKVDEKPGFMPLPVFDKWVEDANKRT